MLLSFQVCEEQGGTKILTDEVLQFLASEKPLSVIVAPAGPRSIQGKDHV